MIPVYLRLNKRDLQKIMQQAKKGLPNEVCGLLGVKDNVVHAWRATNVGTKKAWLDARHGFFIDPAAEEAIEKEMRKVGQKHLGWYHSHPTAPAVFSAEDKRGAKEFTGGPPYTHALFLVIGFEPRPHYQAYYWKNGFKEYDLPAL